MTEIQTLSALGIGLFIDGYTEAALWSETGDDGRSLGETYTKANHLHPETVARFAEDCTRFVSANAALISGREEESGVDFWLTRNGHGSGFWDGAWGENGDALTESSHTFGKAELYVGDDGKVYQY